MGSDEKKNREVHAIEFDFMGFQRKFMRVNRIDWDSHHIFTVDLSIEWLVFFGGFNPLDH